MANIAPLAPYAKWLNPDGTLAKDPVRFLEALRLAAGTGQVTNIGLGASPFTFTFSGVGSVFVSGGTVTSITFTRGSSSFTTGVTQGMIRVNTGDTITITYTAPPTVTFVPG